MGAWVGGPHKRVDENRVGGSGGSQTVGDPLIDARMQQPFEPFPIFRPAEHQRPQPGAVQRTILSQHGIAETLGDGSERRRAWFDNAPRLDVRIHDFDAELREPIGNSRLAAADSASDAHDVVGGGLRRSFKCHDRA